MPNLTPEDLAACHHAFDDWLEKKFPSEQGYWQVFLAGLQAARSVPAENTNTNTGA